MKLAVALQATGVCKIVGHSANNFPIVVPIHGGASSSVNDVDAGAEAVQIEAEDEEVTDEGDGEQRRTVEYSRLVLVTCSRWSDD